MANRLVEIETRMNELRSILNSNDELDIDAISREIDDLTNERSALNERMKAVRSKLGDKVDVITNDKPEQRATAASVEYRDAWAAMMMGKTLTDEQRSYIGDVNPEMRDYTHTTVNTEVLVPESVVSGIWARAAEVYSLWGDVRKFAVNGTLTSKRHVSIDAGDAEWYDEADEVADEQNTFGEFTLTGCELAKSVTVSWKLRAMAVPEFISFITREIGERVGSALGNAVWAGLGKPGASDTFKAQPLGILTALEAEAGAPQIVPIQGDAPTDAEIRAAIAKLHSSYVNGANVYASNATVWTTLAAVKDGNDHSIFVPDAKTEGAVGRVFGLPVKVDAAIDDGMILIANPSMYWANIAEQMTMHTEEHVKARTTDYMGYAIVDGAPYDTAAFAIVGLSADIK